MSVKWFKGMNLLVFLVLFGLTAGPALADSRPDLVIAVTKNPIRLDPMGENSNVNSRVIFSVLESMIGLDFKNNSKLIPALATSWERIDSQTLELKLREGVKCHNGEDFDAEDVAFSFGPKRYMGDDAPGGPVGKGFLGDIQSVEAVDKYTVLIKTGSPDPLLEQRVAGSMGACICKDAFEAAGSWEEWNKAPVGTGPYKVTEYRHSEYLRLEAFDDYWGEKAPAKTITFKIVPEMSARIAGLITGEYHIITEIMPDQFKTIEDNENTEVVGGPINNIRVIFYDEIASPVLADPRIRQALSYAIDRKLLVDTIFDGRTGVPKGLQMESFGDLYVKDFKNITYNPEKAKELLKEAGYKGEEISYRYLQDYYTGEVATAQILADMWRQVGLKVKLELKENWEQIETEGAAEGRGIINWSNTAVYPDPLAQLYRNYGPDGWFQRYNMYKCDEFNKWGKVLSGIDPRKRREAMEHMCRYTSMRTRRARTCITCLNSTANAPTWSGIQWAVPLWTCARVICPLNRLTDSKGGRFFGCPLFISFPEMFMAPILEVSGLEVAFRNGSQEIKVLHGVDLNVEEGEILGLVGESGSGKSLTCLAVMRLLRQNGRAGGRIRFRGTDILGLSEEDMPQVRGRRIAMIFQDPTGALNPVKSIGRQIMEVFQTNGHGQRKDGKIRDRAARLLSEVGIPDPHQRLKEYPHQLSGGQNQRVMIAMMLAGNPDLLIADEPTTALDVTIQSQILWLLKRLRDQRAMAIILVTHDLGVVAETCDRMAVMYCGRIVETGPVKEVFSAPRHPYTYGLLHSRPRVDRAEQTLNPIKGVVPMPTDLPKGCAFAPRCNMGANGCHSHVPELILDDRNRGFACMNPLPGPVQGLNHDTFPG